MYTTFDFRNLRRQGYSGRQVAVYRFRAEGHVTVFVCEIPCCILRGPGRERIGDVVPGGTELEPQVKTGSWAGRTRSQ